ENREFLLADYGPATVLETTEPRGVFESDYRSSYADADNKQLNKDLTDYVSSQYLAKKLGDVQRSEPADLSKPFRLTIRATPAHESFAALGGAPLAHPCDPLSERRPDDLQNREPHPNRDPDPGGGKPKKPRPADFQLPKAFINEWEYHIVPPAGFQAKPLPP